MLNLVRFAVPSSIAFWHIGPVAKPVCKTAYYLCMLAGSNRLSLKELFVVSKIGFNIQYIREQVSSNDCYQSLGGVMLDSILDSNFMSFVDKIMKIQAIIDKTSSDGERQAAVFAKERFLAKMLDHQSNQPIEYTVTLDSHWKKRLFVALCSKHGFTTYRYPRQKYTTTRLKVSKNFMDNVLWPQFKQYADMLEDLVEEILKDLISKIHHVQEEINVQGKSTSEPA